jgi:hypothetical protein
MYDTVIAAIKVLNPSQDQWNAMRIAAGLTIHRTGTSTPHRHMIWLRSKARRGLGISKQTQLLHEFVLAAVKS